MDAAGLDLMDGGTIDLELSGSGLGGGGSGATSYDALTGKPSIEGHELVGDSTIQQIGVGTLSVQDIEKILWVD